METIQYPEELGLVKQHGIEALYDYRKKALDTIMKAEAFEINDTRRELLSKIKGCTVSPYTDFVKYAMNGAAEQFDRIMINPPFERQNPIAHVVAAFKTLKKGGRLLAVMPLSIMYNGDTAFSYFREKFMPLCIPLTDSYDMRNYTTNASHEKMLFLKSGIFQWTDYPACIICLEKPKGDKP